MEKRDFSSNILRGISIIILVVFFTFITLCFLLEVTQFDFTDKSVVTDAKINLVEKDFNSDKPVALNGEWDVYTNLYLEQYNADKLVSPERFTLPTSNLSEFNGFTTYRITLDTASDTSNLALFMPNYRSDVSIYVNGTLQQQPQSDEGYWNYKLLGSKIFKIDLKENFQNELVLSVGQNDTETNPLYKRHILLGSLGSIYIYAYLSMASNVFLFGLLIILTISAYVFVFLYPQHRAIALITLLDSLIIFHVFFGVRNIIDYIGYIIGGIYLSDSILMSLQIFFLMMAGAFGSLLAKYLFDPQGKTPGILWKPLPYIYIVIGIIFSIRLDWAESFGTYIMLTAFLYTALALVFQLTYYWHSNKNIYAFVQIMKTIYFGIVAMLDIFYMQTSANMMYLAYAYVLFLVIHLFIRLYDNKMSYWEVESLNHNLEEKVDERTAELVKLNNMLSNLSIRDSLTNAYNRLHFEKHMEKLITEFDPAHDILFLCMFDLDHFKKINDTYGHGAGDEQLKELVRKINSIIDDHTLLARIGGEEFILLFDNHTITEVEKVLECIRSSLEQDAKLLTGRTTASFGVVRYVAGMTLNHLLKKVDVSLYRAKEEGRNRIIIDI